MAIRIPDTDHVLRRVASDMVRRREDLSVTSLKSGGSLYVFVDPRKGLERMRQNAKEEAER